VKKKKALTDKGGKLRCPFCRSNISNTNVVLTKSWVGEDYLMCRGCNRVFNMYSRKELKND